MISAFDFDTCYEFEKALNSISINSPTTINEEGICQKLGRTKGLKDICMLYLNNHNNCVIPPIKNVIFNKPATIIQWANGDKTVVKCQDGDEFSKESGLAIAIVKYMLGNKGNFNKLFKQWC